VPKKDHVNLSLQLVNNMVPKCNVLSILKNVLEDLNLFAQEKANFVKASGLVGFVNLYVF